MIKTISRFRLNNISGPPKVELFEYTKSEYRSQQATVH